MKLYYVVQILTLLVILFLDSTFYKKEEFKKLKEIKGRNLGFLSSNLKNAINYFKQQLSKMNNVEPMNFYNYNEISHRIKMLQYKLRNRKIDAYVLFNNDAHNTEFINLIDKKIEFLTNFSGSYGMLIVPRDKKPILFTVSLYELQVKEEVNSEYVNIKIINEKNKNIFYKTLVELNVYTLAFDGKNTSYDVFEKIKNYLMNHEMYKYREADIIFLDEEEAIIDHRKLKFIILKNSLVKISTYIKNRKKVFIHDSKYNGMSIEDKLEQLKNFFKENRDVKYLLISDLSEISYILNLRGFDYKCSPIFYSYLFFQYNHEKNKYHKIILFTKIENITYDIDFYLKKNDIMLYDYDKIHEYLKKNIAYDSDEEEEEEELNQIKYKICMSPTINILIYYNVFGNEIKILLKKSYIIQMRANKNDIEIESMKQAHILDAIALLQFFHWTNELKKNKQLFDETEISLREKIEYFRSKKETFLMNSFDTISAIGKNSAIIHYVPTKKTNTKITPNIFLLDSGGQYLYGTTDVTRTTHFGTPLDKEKKAYTLVLKGHLHLRRIVFKSYIKSNTLDFVARLPLLEHFMDFPHSTGHGVGLCLNVHENGCSISPLVGETLKKNMVLSNEPGLYLDQEFGIRIENVQYVTLIKKGMEEFLSFEDLTLYPYDKQLLDLDLLTKSEIKQIDDYHLKIRNTLLPILNNNLSEYGDQSLIDYLIEITDPIQQ